MARIAIKIVIVACVLYVLIWVLLILFQEKLIFMPSELPQDYKYEFSYDFKELYLESHDGKARLNALHFKVNSPKGIVVYYHGNAGQLADWGHVVQDFAESGYDVLVVDYRGYGKSTGKLSEKALYSDALLFYNYALERYPENNIVVYGRSLGTTFATYVAAKNNPSKLFLEAPFYSMKYLVQQKFPIFPVTWSLRYHFPTDEFIKEVSCPIVIFHGMNDTMIDIENSKKLAALIPEDQLRFISIPNGGHNDLVNELGYREAIDSLLH